ncbi:MAG: sigma-70 family RNA polymerase sigma factor [Bacteroidetes bacterium]|nr:sigma-70 family RNA polymerase sigma factor [Bacteroidota bacterium]
MGSTLDDIIEGCKKQDAKSQDALYLKYASLFFAICLRYLKDKDDAKDVLQDSFIKIYDKIVTFKGEGSFEGWIKKIVVNNCLQYLNQKKKVLKIENELWIEGSEETVEVEVEEDDQIDASVLFNMIKELPVGYRTVFNMFVFDGFGHAEIAAQLKISEGTSKSQLAKARKYLKERIKEYQKNEQKEYKY